MSYKDPETLRRLSKEERLTQEEIASKFGVTAGTISRWMNRHDISPSPVPDDPDDIRSLLEEHGSISSAARSLDISDSTLRYHMDKHDIEWTTDQRIYTDEELLQKLRDRAETHGRPTKESVYNDDTIPSPKTYQSRFGSWSNALRRIGIDTPDGLKQYDVAAVKQRIRERADALDVVNARRICDAEDMPSTTWVTKNIKPWSDLYDELGVTPEYPDWKKCTKSDVVDTLISIDEPITTQKLEDELNVCTSTLYTTAGSIKELCDEVGVTFDDQRGRTGNQYTDEELISKLHTCYDRYGTVKVGLLKGDDDLPSHMTYVHRFGSWSEAKRRADLEDDIDSRGAPDDTIPDDKYTHRYTSTYLDVRDNVRERDNYSCRICGRDKDDLGRHPDTHHISWEYDDPDDAHQMDNLVTLCQRHHHMVESGEIPCPDPSNFSE